VAEVVRSGYVNEGARTAKLAELIAADLGVRHVLAAPSGTIALFLAMRALGVGPGDEVIVPDLTFIATANAVFLCGATPVLADIGAHDFNIDPVAVDRLVTPRTRAVVAVHIDGRAADMQALRAICDRNGLALIEDAAQALGSRCPLGALGTLADAGCVSLAPTKIITAGQGGLVMTDRDDVRDAVVRLKDHGRLSRSWNYHPEVGFNFKFSDVHAAIALAQYARMPERIERSHRQFAQYRDGLAGTPGLTIPETDVENGTVPLWVDALVDDAPGLIAHLGEQGIDCRPFWPAIHTQDPYRTLGECPVSADVASRGVWFPSGAGKTEADIARVIAAVRAYLERRSAATARAGA